MNDTRIEEIRDRLQKGTPGPWRVYREENPLNELGKKTFPDGATQVQVSIHTSWEHGQLGGPAPVVCTQISPYFEKAVTIHIRDNDAEFIAHSKDDVKFLLGEIERMKALMLEISIYKQ